MLNTVFIGTDREDFVVVAVALDSINRLAVFLNPSSHSSEGF